MTDDEAETLAAVAELLLEQAGGGKRGRLLRATAEWLLTVADGSDAEGLERVQAEVRAFADS